MSEFHDKDPEDSWDDGDPVAVKLAILEQVIAHVRSNWDTRFEARRADALRLVDKLKQQQQQEGSRLETIKVKLEEL